MVISIKQNKYGYIGYISIKNIRVFAFIGTLTEVYRNITETAQKMIDNGMLF